MVLATIVAETGKIPEEAANAAKRGDEAALLAWIDSGGNANAFDSAGFTLLMSAADHGHEQVVELLLQRGAEIDLQNSDCGTAMIYAAGSGKDRVV